jgi:hypothetical protein
MPFVFRWSFVSCALALVVTSGVAGCKGGSSTSGGAAAPTVAAGAERGACRPDATCDPGLVCLSPLGPIFLDNYTPREEREAFAADVRAECGGANFTREDGECLARAKTRQDINACPRPIGLGDCKKILAHADEVRVRSGVDAYLVTPADRLVERCKSEVPTRGFERCVLAATTMSDLERCAW